MDITSSTNTAINTISQAKNPSKSEIDSKKLDQDYNDFLRLLTTQLQNQDPTQPLDTNQFTQQIATLSQVEQSINTNKNLETLVSLFGANQISTGVSYIGKFVEVPGSTGSLVDSEAQFAYDLDKQAASTTVTILDENKQAVFTGKGTTFEGKNYVVWDGSNSFTGGKEKDGNYTIAILAKDAAGKTIENKTYTVGIVDGVETGDGKTYLSVSGQRVEIDKVSGVRNVPSKS